MAPSTILCQELILNGGFENGFDDWDIKEVVGGCSVVQNNGTHDPFGPGNTAAPIEGAFDALTEQTKPGTCIIKQSVQLPPNIFSATLSWKDRVRTYAREFSDPLQEARVEVIVDGQLPEIMVWSTNPGDPAIQLRPNARSFNVTSVLVGKSQVEVRLEEQHFFGFFNMNWDAVSLEVCHSQ